MRVPGGGGGELCNLRMVRQVCVWTFGPAGLGNLLNSKGFGD